MSDCNRFDPLAALHPHHNVYRVHRIVGRVTRHSVKIHAPAHHIAHIPGACKKLPLFKPAGVKMAIAAHLPAPLKLIPALSAIAAVLGGAGTLGGFGGGDGVTAHFGGGGSVHPVAVSEPLSIMLLATGMLAVVLVRKWR